MTEAVQEKVQSKWREFDAKTLGLEKDDIKFKTGPFKLSAGILNGEEGLKGKEIKAILLRHVGKDWGEADKNENDASLSNGGRVMSIYTVREKQVWILTEFGGADTKMLFPEEYE